MDASSDLRSSFAGNIIDGGVGALGVVKSGHNRFSLWGNNSYTGGTTLNGGELIAESSTAFVNNTAYQINSGRLNLNDNKLVMSSLGGVGGVVSLGSAALTIDQREESAYAGVIEGTGKLTKEGSGTLVLTGSNTYAGGTTISSGTLQLGNGLASGSIVGDIENDGTLSLNRSDTVSLDGAIYGTGSVIQSGRGTTVLSGVNSYSGATLVGAGTLAAGGANLFSSKSDYSTSSGGTLDLRGFDQTLLKLNHSGTVQFGTLPGTTLTVSQDYVGDNGTLVLSSFLGDDTSKTDRLIINGNSTGFSNVRIVPSGEAGAATVEGIKIIEVAGNSDGTFALIGDYVHNGEQAIGKGAFTYKLYKNGVSTPTDGDWYLRSQFKESPTVDPVDPGMIDPGKPVDPKPLYQAGVPVYEAYPQVLLGLNGLPTLKQRVGNRSWNNGGNRLVSEGADAIGTPVAAPEEAGNLTESNGVWGRIEGSHNRIDPRSSTTLSGYEYDVYKMQAGLDGKLFESEAGNLIGGITVHYARGSADTWSVYDADGGGGQIRTSGYGFGGTLTWYGDNGFYLDAQGQTTWYDSDLSFSGGNQSVVDRNNGFGYSLSLEGGKRIALNQS